MCVLGLFDSTTHSFIPRFAPARGGYFQFRVQDEEEMGSRVRVLYDFEAQSGSGELTIRTDEILSVTREVILPPLLLISS